MLETVIIKEELIAPQRLRQLQARRHGPGVRRLLAQGLLYLATGAGLVLATDPLFLALFLLLNGVAQFAMFGMLHEACHRTAFASNALSDLAGWVAALAQPMTPALMRDFHFEHHRHTHELERDPELAGMPMMLSWPRGIMWVLTMTGLPIVVARVGWTLFAALVPPGRAWDRVLPFTRPRHRSRIAWEARALVLIHGAIVATAVLVWPELARIYLGMLLGHAFTSWYITAEHRGLPPGGTILERTRSVRVPAPVRWLLWNMPYHAEHHAWPAVPFHALPALHAEVRPHLVHHASLLQLHLRRGQ